MPKRKPVLRQQLLTPSIRRRRRVRGRPRRSLRSAGRSGLRTLRRRQHVIGPGRERHRNRWGAIGRSSRDGGRTIVGGARIDEGRAARSARARFKLLRRRACKARRAGRAGDCPSARRRNQRPRRRRGNPPLLEGGARTVEVLLVASAFDVGAADLVFARARVKLRRTRRRSGVLRESRWVRRPVVSGRVFVLVDQAAE
jgi:hypothetical protein